MPQKYIITIYKAPYSFEKNACSTGRTDRHDESIRFPIGYLATEPKKEDDIFIATKKPLRK